MIVIIKMNESNFEEAVNFIARLQLLSEHHIGYFGVTFEEISTYIKELEVNWRKSSLLGFEDERLVGAIITDYDPEIKRAWIHGPIVDHQEWQSIADKLYDELRRQVIPKYVTELELYGERLNTNLNKFSKRHGFVSIKSSCVLQFPRAKLASLPKIEGQVITEEYYEAFKLLHAKLFPGTYYTGIQILNKLDNNNTVLMETENQTLLGFVRGKLEKETNEGYIDFVGVAESARRKGIGKRLVVAILHWLFRSFPQINVVTLTVYETNIPAISLYINLGFKKIRLLQGYRKTIEGNRT